MIAELNGQIDRILHGDDSIDIQMFKEGEMYILQNQINKMTVRLRENASLLKKDKTYLADSLADISHQLRTPMTSLQILLTFLSKSTLNETERANYSREAEALLSRMDWLLSALLKISKIDTGTAVFAHEKVKVSELIKRSTEPFAIPLELQNIELKINCDESLSFVGDINWTAEAVGNILKNCIEHTRNLIEINCTENAIYTEIIISDNGAGIDKTDLPHIFERFYRGENYSENNYGIGLALCRMILSKQNATVKAENSEKGAKFIIKFYKVTDL